MSVSWKSLTEELEEKIALSQTPSWATQTRFASKDYAEEDLPWYKDVLNTVTSGFDWIQENLEKPWASILTAPFSPSLPYKSGESWFEHEKREYEQWNAPKFVKGIAEFTMPLWWIPYFGWSLKAAKATGIVGKSIQSWTELISHMPKVGGGFAKGITTAEKIASLPVTLPLKGVGKVGEKLIKLPKFEELRAKMFADDHFRLLAQKLAKIPGMKGVVEAVNPSAIKSGLAGEGMVVHGGLNEMGIQAVNAAMPRITKYGDAVKLFGVDDMARVTKVTPKVEGESLAWGDVFASPQKYNLNKVQKAYIDDYSKLIDDAVSYATESGVKINRRDFAEGSRYIPRVVQGRAGIIEREIGVFRPIGSEAEPELWRKLLPDGTFVELTTKDYEEITLRMTGRAVGGRRIGAKPFFMKPRFYDYMEEGIKRGVKYGADPNVVMDTFLRGIYKTIVDKTTADVLKPLGKTVKELTSVTIRQQVDDAAKVYRSAIKVTNRLGRMSQKTILTKDDMNVIRRYNEGIAKRIDDAMLKTGKEKADLLKQIKADAIKIKEDAWHDYTVAKRARTRAYEQARSMPGWKAVGQPFASGRLFPEPVAKELSKMLQDRGSQLFTKVSQVNALSRFIVTGFDFGAGMIQGVPLLMSHPLKWGKAMKYSVQAFFDPTVRSRYLLEPKSVEVLQELVPHGLLIGESEFMETTAAGGLINKLPETIRKLTGTQRWASAFNTWGDLARIEWGKSFLPIAKRDNWSLDELASFLNEATGVISSRALGLGATHREVEAAMLFAPRYFRANMALWSDMLRGGLRGTLARDTMASMIMGGFFWYYGICKTLGQEPNFDPSSGKFMTVQIGSQHVGLGSMQVAMLRLLGNIYATATENPEGFIKMDTRDNPLLRFARTRISPLMGSTWDIATGKTYIGEPLDDPLDIFREEVASRLAPFWLSQYITDYPRPGGEAIPPEIMGLRTWPLQFYERRDELRETLAQRDFNKSWYGKEGITGLNEVQKKELLEKYPELKEVTDLAEAQRVERADVDDKIWFSFKEDRQRARSEYESRLWAAQQRFDSGEITGYQFKELAQEAGSQLRGAYRNIESNESYKDVMEFLAQPMSLNEVQNTPVEDIAYDEYMSLMYSGDLEDASGEYNFEQAELRRQIFIAQWGEDVYNYVLERLNQGKDIPPLMQEYYVALEMLRPYWQVKSDVMKMGARFAESKAGQKLIRRTRELMLVRNPELRRYYDLFYTREAWG